MPGSCGTTNRSCARKGTSFAACARCKVRLQSSCECGRLYFECKFDTYIHYPRPLCTSTVVLTKENSIQRRAKVSARRKEEPATHLELAAYRPEQVVRHRLPDWQKCTMRIPITCTPMPKASVYGATTARAAHGRVELDWNRPIRPQINAG